ncbi:MAG: glycosyltransferase family 2 protein [Cytophagaceae bacterium]
MKKITILIPTYNRVCSLSVLLTSLCYQEEKNFDIIISDQSTENILLGNISLKCSINLLNVKGHEVTVKRNNQKRGMAHQRQFLLDHCETEYALFLDDDLILEPYVIKNLLKALEKGDCGFAGAAVIGLSYKNDIRPSEQNIEFWKEEVKPEYIKPGSVEWNRFVLHNAANVYHLQERYCRNEIEILRYKVAWIGGCTMYNTEKLKDCGGFSFWKDLPANHCGEDVLAQLRVMKKYGGCGILPSGVYHQELETTVPDRRINAPEYLPI